MTESIPNQLPAWTETYSEPYRAFAFKLMRHMEHALKVEDDRRKHGQICAILNCLTDKPTLPKVWGFWCAEAKELAKEWEALRTATLQARADREAYLKRLEEEDRARQAALAAEASAPAEQVAPQEPVTSSIGVEEAAPQEPASPAPATTTTEKPAPDEPTPPAKPKREYRKIEYVDGQNPFRAGSKNAKVWNLLVEGGHTAEAIAEASAADLKSVNYLIWLARRSGIEIQADKETKTYRLAPEAQPA
jgi:hypothetical protein